MTRVVITGAGIAGASAAYHLSTRGAEVVVVDDGRAGQATAAGAGIITPVSARAVSEAKSRVMFAAVAHHLDLVARFEEAGFTDHSHDVTGELIVALDDAEQARLDDAHRRARSLVATLGTAGVGDPSLLTAEELARLHPPIAPATGALWLPEVARIDGRVVRDLLLALAVRNGARIVESGAELVAVGERVTGVRTSQGSIDADDVVLAAGCWSAALAAEIGVDLAVYPQRGQIVHLKHPAVAALPVISAFVGCYLLGFPGDRVVVGATREDDAGFAVHATAGGIEMLLERGRRVVPALSDAEWLEVRVGLRPASPDGEPLVGPASYPGLWLATGFGPQGLTLAPYMGAQVAAAIAGDHADLPEIFAPGRPLATTAVNR